MSVLSLSTFSSLRQVPSLLLRHGDQVRALVVVLLSRLIVVVIAMLLVVVVVMMVA